MNQRDLIRLSIMLVALGINALLSHYAFDKSTGSPLWNTVRVGCYAVLAMAVILVAKACVCGGGDRQPKHPRLSMETVFVHVYGLGLIIFVAIYCVAGGSGDASAAFFIQLIAISVDDTFTRTRDPTLRRSLLFFCGLLSGVSSVCSALSVRGAGESVLALYSQQWAVVMYALFLPCSVPWVFFSVRGKRFYNPVTIHDFIHFGMPFAVILACLALLQVQWAHEGALAFSQLNVSSANGTSTWRVVTAADVSVPLLAVNMLTTVFFAIQSILLYSTVDFLATYALVTSVKSMVEGSSADPLVAVAFVSAFVAYGSRFYACYSDEGDKHSVAYSRETEEDEEDDQVLAKLQVELQGIDN